MIEFNLQSQWMPDSNFGINLEFGKRPSWFITPFFIIIIIWKNAKNEAYYINDFYQLKKSYHGWHIYKHFEPFANTKYFNLGFNRHCFFIGNFIITRSKFHDNLPLIEDEETMEQKITPILIHAGYSPQEIKEFKNSGGFMINEAMKELVA